MDLFLKAYALQTALNSKLGMENEIINYQSEQQIRQYSVFINVSQVEMWEEI